MPSTVLFGAAYFAEPSYGNQSPAHQSGNPTPDASALDRYFGKWQNGLLLLI
ncbi:hypothetical protein [Stutzerimonas zhaodongensis]|uniref:hypothetical protein n=1 Tax=Stutzerimonas zhaodongensis TaxID=1176257 RepID=UPI00142D8822|nr:hypothetical protein [Stutzerimonas zhaodongensis]MCQ4316295.1 hypothetical protein [Stutzerimonas zhaodongensis]